MWSGVNGMGVAKADPNADAIKKLQQQLDSLNKAETTEGNRVRYLEVHRRMDDLLLKQEIYWTQRSRIPWLKYCDKNTKIFHSKASQRRQRNHIKGIKNGEGQWVEDMEDIVNVAIEYFDNLFCAGSCDQMEECLNAVSCKVTPKM